MFKMEYQLYKKFFFKLYIETVIINGLNVVDIDIQFNDITFCSTILTSALANPDIEVNFFAPKLL